jgi:outer membrane PBP1 activator LpoA protein
MSAMIGAARLRDLICVMTVAAALALTACGSDANDADPTTVADRPVEISDTRIDAFRSRMAQACRRARRDAGAGAATTMHARAAQARRQRGAYAALAARIVRLKPPPAARPRTRRYLRLVRGAVRLADQTARKADEQQPRQVTLLVRALHVNTRRRDEIADRLRIAPC